MQLARQSTAACQSASLRVTEDSPPTAFFDTSPRAVTQKSGKSAIPSATAYRKPYALEPSVCLKAGCIEQKSLEKLEDGLQPACIGLLIPVGIKVEPILTSGMYPVGTGDSRRDSLEERADQSPMAQKLKAWQKELKTRLEEAMRQIDLDTAHSILKPTDSRSRS